MYDDAGSSVDDWDVNDSDRVNSDSSCCINVSYSHRPSMSGLHLVKQGRDRRRIDLQRDFTVASPAEFVTRFGGNKVIEKVCPGVV